MRKFLASLSALAVVFATATPALADDTWAPKFPPQGEQGLALYEYGGRPMISFIAAQKGTWGKDEQNTICEKLGEAECAAGSGWSVYGNISLGVCIDNEVNCIESVQIYKNGELPKSAKFIKNVDAPTFAGDESKNLPRGSSTGLWQAQDLEHTGANKNYAVWVGLDATVENGKVALSTFSAGAAGVLENTTDGLEAPKIVRGVDAVSGQKFVRISSPGPSCVYTYVGLCGHAQNFAPQTRIGITMRISNNLSGWLTGRLGDPVITVAKFNSTISKVKIDAMPVAVPKFSASFTAGSFPEALKTNPRYQLISSRLGGTNSWLTSESAASDAGIAVVEDFRALKNDTADGLATLWSVASTAFSGSGVVKNCFADTSKLLGLVTTNSMAFEGSAPRFENGSLNYQVAGMHYLKDGAVAQGSYDLIIRSETARCLYGFSNAPLSATVSVTGGTDKNVAVTTVSEKNGWLKLSAKGFTFSKKTIKVKIAKKAIKKAVKKK